ncbi:MAG: hypothetical protein IKM64_10515, partial [Clostridia bacterium]|nr:hypothetical protein [Clostridia bacterium]
HILPENQTDIRIFLLSVCVYYARKGTKTQGRKGKKRGKKVHLFVQNDEKSLDIGCKISYNSYDRLKSLSHRWGRWAVLGYICFWFIFAGVLPLQHRTFILVCVRCFSC